MRNLKCHIKRNIVGIPADRGQVKMKAFLLSMAMLLACIVVAESAPYSADIRNIEGFDELVRDYLQAVQRDSHMEKLTCAECQGNTARNCTLVEREVQCNTGEVCTTLEAFNLDTITTTVTRGCFNLTGLNCYDSPGCNALNTTGNVQSCAQFCCNTSLCNAGTLTTETPPTTPPTTLAPTTPLVCDAILGQSGNFTSPNFPADYPNGVTCIAVANVPANRQMRFSVDFIQLADPGDTLIISDGSVVVLRFTGPLNRVVKRSVDDQSSYESTESYNNNQDYKDYYHFDGRRKEEPYPHVRHKRRSGNVVTITGRGQNVMVTFNADGSGSAAGFLVSFEERAVSEPETEKEKETESEPESEGEGSDDPSDDDK